MSVTDDELAGRERYRVLAGVSAASGVSLEDIEDVEDVEDLRRTVRDRIEAAVGSHALGPWFLSLAPLRKHRRDLPVPGVDRIEPTEKWSQSELERAALTALGLTYSLGRDPLGRRAPLHLELEFALKFSELMESYRQRLNEMVARAAIPMVFHELSRLYAWVAPHWPRKRPRASSAVSAAPTNKQTAVLAEATDRIRTILEIHGRCLPYVGDATALIPSIVFDGPKIRALGGPRDAASAALTTLTGLAERTFQATLNPIVPLEVARLEQATIASSAFQLPQYVADLLAQRGSGKSRLREAALPKDQSR